MWPPCTCQGRVHVPTHVISSVVCVGGMSIEGEPFGSSASAALVPNNNHLKTCRFNTASTHHEVVGHFTLVACYSSYFEFLIVLLFVLFEL